MHTPLLWWLRTAPVTQGGTHRRDPRGLGGCLGADDRGERPCSHTRAGRHPGHGRPQLTSLSDRVPSVPAVPAPFAHQTRLPGAFARVLLAPGRLPKDSCTTICTLLMGTCSRRSPTHGLPGLLLTLRCQPRPSGHPALLLTLRCQPHLSGHPGFMLTLGCQRRPRPPPPSCSPWGASAAPGPCRPPWPLCLWSWSPALCRNFRAPCPNTEQTPLTCAQAFPSTNAVPGRQARSSLCRAVTDARVGRTSPARRPERGRQPQLPVAPDTSPWAHLGSVGRISVAALCPPGSPGSTTQPL